MVRKQKRGSKGYGVHIPIYEDDTSKIGASVGVLVNKSKKKKK